MMLLKRRLVLFVLIETLSFSLSEQMALAQNRCEFDLTVNGANLRYDLSPLLPFHGECRPFYAGSVRLARGESIQPFYTTTDGPLKLLYGRDVGPVVFTGVIRALENPHLTLDELPSHYPSGDDWQQLLYPHGKPSSAITFTTINARHWLVRTKFEDPQKKIPQGRVYLTLEGGQRVLLTIIFRDRAPRDISWREKRLALLEELVRRLRINHRQ